MCIWLRSMWQGLAMVSASVTTLSADAHPSDTTGSAAAAPDSDAHHPAGEPVIAQPEAATPPASEAPDAAATFSSVPVCQSCCSL